MEMVDADERAAIAIAPARESETWFGDAAEGEAAGDGRRDGDDDFDDEDGFDREGVGADGDGGMSADGDDGDLADGADALMSVGEGADAPSTSAGRSAGASEGIEDNSDEEAGGSRGKKTVKKQRENQSRENRRVRQFRSASEITQEELSSCFHLPSEAACRKLGVGLTVLKRQCRKYGIKRWPFRKMKSLDRLITNVQAGISPGDQNRLLVKSVEELEDQKRKMEECAVLDLDDTTKKLQQAYSKANHKARRNRSEAARIRAQATAFAARELEARSRGGYGYEPKGTNETLLDLAHQIHDATPEVDKSISAAVESFVKPDVEEASREDDVPLMTLLSNTPNGRSDASEDAKKPSLSPTSNPKPKKGTVVPTEYSNAANKVLTAVRGAWSPARPARRQDDASDAEAFLSPRSRTAASDDEGEEAKLVPLKPRGRGRPPGPSKRGRKRKGGDLEDDPLASLAAAALDSMGNARVAPSRPIGRPRSVGSSSDGTRPAQNAGKFKSAFTEDHPAFGLAPAAKGARTGAQSRLSQIERADLEHLFRDRLTKGKQSLCDAFSIDPLQFDRHFSPKLQATSLATAVERLATKSSR